MLPQTCRRNHRRTAIMSVGNPLSVPTLTMSRAAAPDFRPPDNPTYRGCFFCSPLHYRVGGLRLVSASTFPPTF